MTKVARIISIIFHPLFMPLVGFYIIFNCGIFEVDIPSEVLHYTYLLVILFSIFLPVSIIPFLLYYQLAQDIEISKRKERFAPVFFSSLSLLILFIVLNRRVPISLIQAFAMATACCSILILFFNILFKISMHLVALGGITGLIAFLTIQYGADLFFWLSVVIFVTGVVTTSRLYLQAHKIFEIISGYLIGFITTYICIFLVVK